MYKYLNEDGDSDFVRILIVLIMVFTLQCLKLIIWTVKTENDPTRPLEYFTSFNVMDMYSYKNSLSVDQ